MLFVGDDWAEEAHDVELQDGSGSVLRRAKLAEGVEGMARLHALIGACGLLVGGALYALSFDWVKANILPVGAMGKVQLPQLLGIGAPMIFAALTIVAILMFALIERYAHRMR